MFGGKNLFQKDVVTEDHIAALYSKYGLASDLADEELRLKLTEILNNPLTMVDGIQLLLGRRIDVEEIKDDFIHNFTFLIASGETKYSVLMQYKRTLLGEA